MKKPMPHSAHPISIGRDRRPQYAGSQRALRNLDSSDLNGSLKAQDKGIVAAQSSTLEEALDSFKQRFRWAHGRCLIWVKKCQLRPLVQRRPVESRPNGSSMGGGASGRHLPEKDQTGNASLDHFVGPDE